MYYLMDLERTILAGVPCYWKGNQHGYTYSITEAGLFSKEFAEKICKQDLDQTTVKINQTSVQKVLEKVQKTI